MLEGTHNVQIFADEDVRIFMILHLHVCSKRQSGFITSQSIRGANRDAISEATVIF